MNNNFFKKLKTLLKNMTPEELERHKALLKGPPEKPKGWLSIEEHLPVWKAKDFEQKFDENYDITAALDLSKAKRVLQEQKRVNVDFPTWMIESLDREARKLGVTRQSIIKVWLAERLQKSDLTHRPSGDS